MNFFYVEKNEYVNKMSDWGINWSRLPSFTLVTPKGNAFPIAYSVNLGDANTVDSIINQHIEGFVLGKLSSANQ